MNKRNVGSEIIAEQQIKRSSDIDYRDPILKIVDYYNRNLLEFQDFIMKYSKYDSYLIDFA